MRRTARAPLLFLAALALLEYAIYFWRAGHFFQADTIYWFYNRLRSPGEFLNSFLAPDPGGWYRPLTNRTIQSLLYPFLGLNPSGYRWVSFVLFFLCTVALAALAFRMTRKPAAAAMAAFFFAIHTVNAYTTYDLSFTPELLYTFLYICGCLSFLVFLETGERTRWINSAVCFVLALCSKEAAITLPATLFAMALIFGAGFKRSARVLIPHFAIAILYLWFTVLHLGVASEALASLRTRPAQIETGGYYFMVGPHLATNAANAWAWALNLPTGMLGQWRVNTQSRSLVFWSFAAAQMLLIVYALARGERKSLLFGFAWFWIAVSPALPLMNHFLPYYLFLPVAAFALIVGASWNRLYEDCSERSPRLAQFAGGAIAVVLLLVCVRTSRSEATNNFLLGASSRIAETSVNDMKALYPTLPPGATVFIDSDAQPDLFFHHSSGQLFRMVYGDETLQFKYSSLKESPPPGALKLVFENGHLHEAR
jgi:hypothetical protein